MVSRVEAVARASSVWEPGTVPYSQISVHQPDGYRQDCSGYVSMCWALPAPGENTVTLVTEGWMAEIPIVELQPADAIGLCGLGTAGDNGHIQLVEAVTATGLVIWEQAGGQPGPTRRTIKRPTPGYKAYRYAGITDQPSTVEDDMADSDLVQAEAWRMDALTYGSDVVRGGPMAPGGEEMWLVKAVKDLRHKVEQLATTPVQVDASAVAAALVADPAFVKALNDAAFGGAQRAESE